MTEQSDPRWAAGEALPDMVTVGDPQLRRHAVPVDDTSTVGELCANMVGRLRALQGAGLAANQLGEQAAVVVVEVRKTDFFPDRPESPLYVMINPKIVESRGADEEGWEGCYSVPGLMGRVPRSSAIAVRYVTPAGENREERFEGYLARVIQHECDHLVGEIFLDKMASMNSITTIQNYAQFHHPRRTSQESD